jgi:hypothetical protein
MVEFTQTTPFVGIVSSARQKKVPFGTEVEVRIIKEGQYGPYAMAFVEGRDKPVFLNPDHVDFVSDVSAERQAELDAEKAAWLAGVNAPVEIGPGVVHSTGKSVVVDVLVDMEATDQASTRQAFFPLSQVTEVDGIYSAPPWLTKIKAVDAAYYWVSSGGRKGVDHFGGAGIAAHYAGGPSYSVSVGDLHDAEDRAAEGK